MVNYALIRYFISVLYGASYLVAIAHTTIFYPLSSHCNSLEDLVPLDFIYAYLILKWIEVTWLNKRLSIY